MFGFLLGLRRGCLQAPEGGFRSQKLLTFVSVIFTSTVPVSYFKDPEILLMRWELAIKVRQRME